MPTRVPISSGGGGGEQAAGEVCLGAPGRGSVVVVDQQQLRAGRTRFPSPLPPFSLSLSPRSPDDDPFIVLTETKFSIRYMPLPPPFPSFPSLFPLSSSSFPSSLLPLSPLFSPTKMVHGRARAPPRQTWRVA